MSLREVINMHIYRQTYEFAASAGSFEGYVYRRSGKEINIEALSNWVDNLLAAYESLPAEVRDECQLSIDRTLGRAIKSLDLHFNDQPALIHKLQQIVKSELPESPDDFQKEKWFQK